LKNHQFIKRKLINYLIDNNKLTKLDKIYKETQKIIVKRLSGENLNLINQEIFVKMMDLYENKFEIKVDNICLNNSRYKNTLKKIQS